MLPIGFKHWSKNRRKPLENELILSLQDEEIRKIIYGKIDKSILLSFIGGVSLGSIPYLFSGKWTFAWISCLVISLIMFFLARYSGLKFLFYEED